MSVALYTTDEEHLGDVASNMGWHEFQEWVVENLEEPAKNLAENGDLLNEEIEPSIRQFENVESAPEDVLSVIKAVIDVLKLAKKNVFAWDGA